MIEFRPLVREDVHEAVRLWDECAPPPSSSDPYEDACKALDAPNFNILGAFAGQHLIGTAMTGWDGHQGWIYHLGVEKDFRRWGIGRTLIRACEEWLEQYRAPTIQIMARAANEEAVRFYKGIGYEEDTQSIFYRRLGTRG